MRFWRHAECADQGRARGSDVVQQIQGDLQAVCSATGNAIGEQVTSLTGKLSGCTRPESTSALHAGSAQHLDLAAQPWRL